MGKRKLQELITEIEAALVDRGQSANGVAQYHYVYQVFLAYSKSFQEEYFSQEILDRCLREHYGIANDKEPLTQKQNYKKKVIRAYRMLCDRAEGKEFADRYTDKVKLINTPEYIDAVLEFLESYCKSGHSPKTIDHYRRYAEQFLAHAEQNGIFDFNGITGEAINSFILTFSKYRKCTIKSALGGIRSFFKFLYTSEYTRQDLSLLVSKITVRMQSRIPSVWNRDEVVKLLAAIDRNNPSGKRDYAIILLVARLGIRVGDVNNLKFENLNWRQNSIEFVTNKTREPARLPLLKDVGWAIIDYLQNGRPNIDSPYVFLTHIVPFKGYADDNHLHATIKKYMTVAGIQNASRQKRGMHSLRHTLANLMLENHEPIHNISSALVQRSPDSVTYYLKANIEMLRECALSPSGVGI